MNYHKKYYLENKEEIDRQNRNRQDFRRFTGQETKDQKYYRLHREQVQRTNLERYFKAKSEGRIKKAPHYLKEFLSSEEASQEEYWTQIFNDKKRFLYLIKRRINYCLQQGADNFKQEIEDIFYDGLIVFKEKYIDRRIKIHNYDHARHIMYKICFNLTMLFVEKRIDQVWWSRLSKTERKMKLWPPSYYYKKSYLQENREHINARRRFLYQTDPRMKERCKAYRARIKADPIKYQKLLDRQRMYKKNHGQDSK